MEIIVFLEIVLGFLCLLGLVAVIIFFIRKNDQGMDVDKLIKNANNQMNENLKALDLGNKKIDEIEKKILICKKKLNMKLFD